MKKHCSLGIIFLFSSCMVGPNYSPPHSEIPDVWSSEENAPIEAPNLAWWDTFQDPLLTQCIMAAKEHNEEVLKAEANIARSRAIRQIAASSLFPQLVGDVNGIKTYFSKNGPVFAIGPAAGDPGVNPSTSTGLPFSLQIPQIQNLFNALIDASWEIDLFGKIRRSVEQADALVDSAIEERHGVLLSVAAEVSRNYMELRYFQTKERLLQNSIDLWKETLTITDFSVQAGLKSKADLEEAKRNLASAQALLPETLSEIAKSIYTLSILTGKLPEALSETLLSFSLLPSIPDRISVGLRSELLKRRPDVRRAERELAAATAGVGVAVASFFPTINLLGFGGFQSLNLPQLLEWNSRTWGYGADATMPIYQGGKIVGHLRLAQSSEAIQAHEYQQTVLTALQEAESALSAYHQAQSARTFLLEAVLHRDIRVAIGEARFQKGLTDKLSLLNEKQAQIQDLLSLALQDEKTLLSAIVLYKAIGGGWE